VFIVVRVAVQERDLLRVGSAGKTAQAPYALQAPYTFGPSVTLAVQQFMSSDSVPFTSLELDVQLIVLLVSIAVQVRYLVLLGSVP